MKKIILMFSIFVLSVVGCTENQRAKNFGGTQTIELKDKRLIGATWKDSQLWYLTRPLEKDEKPVEWTFQEKSSLGLVEGKVIFKETNSNE